MWLTCILKFIILDGLCGVFYVLSSLLQLATEYGIKFMETSAKASINVEEVS